MIVLLECLYQVQVTYCYTGQKLFVSHTLAVE